MSEPDALDVGSADGTRVRVWRCAPGRATEAVLFVHGATYGGRAAFAPEGYSWLEDVAAAGRAAYALDARGYGDSGSPPELDAPAGDGDPVVRAETAARDARAALGAVRESFETVHLVGYSWGSTIAGMLLDDLGADVASLVQYAPVYSPAADRESDFSPGDPPAAYRTVTEAETRKRWAEQRPGPVPDGAFEAFWEALIDSGQHAGEGRVVAPNGTLVDLTAAVDEPLYDPGAIEVPALVVRGSLDTASRRPDALALYDALGADDRVYTEIAGGTHFMQFESVRRSLVGAVGSFHDRVGG
jgi:alpha-beta hydrolase superfamily lysophospholipase